MHKVAVIGECMVELYQAKDSLYKQTFGGDTLNCSIYLKRCMKNSLVEYITMIGENSLSAQLLNFLKDEDIGFSYIKKDKKRDLGLYMIHTKDGEREFSYWRDNSSAKKLFISKDFDAISQELSSFDLIYFSAITLAIMSPSGRVKLFEAIKKARKRGVSVAYDSNYRVKLYKNTNEAKALYKEAVNNCDIFLPSIDDEKKLWADVSTKDIINRAKRFGCDEVVIKCGDKDIVYSYEGAVDRVKVKRLDKIVDSTSAGDSFNGAYLASRLSKSSVEESIKNANSIASKVIMHQGAIIPKENDE